LVKHEKPNGGRKGAISISTKGKRFLGDVGSVLADYSSNSYKEGPVKGINA
jgi:hypothetical protein